MMFIFRKIKMFRIQTWKIYWNGCSVALFIRLILNHAHECQLMILLRLNKLFLTENERDGMNFPAQFSMPAQNATGDFHFPACGCRLEITCQESPGNRTRYDIWLGHWIETHRNREKIDSNKTILKVWSGISICVKAVRWFAQGKQIYDRLNDDECSVWWMIQKQN